MSRKLLLWLPFIICAGLFAGFYLGLRQPDDHVIASQLVGQPLPQFSAAAALPGLPGTASADFRKGKPRLLNVFASWCVPCAAEGPMLMRLKAKGAVIDGVAVHDNAADLANFLAQNGNPYTGLGLDEDGRAQIAFGSSGVPETFVVDGAGRIIHQQIGPISEQDVPKILAMLGQRR